MNLIPAFAASCDKGFATRKSVGQPEEIAAVVMFAASPENSFMTGVALIAAGGITIEL